jgi:hypothetical protein
LDEDSVVFTLGGLPSNFNVLTDVSNVNFQYGTAFGEPSFPGGPPGNPTAPEPASLVLFGAGIVGLGAFRYLRKRSAVV